MREFIGKENWAFREKQVIEKETGKSFTLTEPKDLFAEDYYTVRRAIAVENCPADVVPENDFFVYQFLYMGKGYCCSKIVDATTAHEIIKSNLMEFMMGGALEAITNFFESEE